MQQINNFKDGVYSIDSYLSSKNSPVDIITMYSCFSDGRNLSDYEKSLLNKIYHLRYKVYCEEFGFTSPYADKINKTIIDTLDNNVFHIFCVINDNIIGCARLNFSIISDLGDFEYLLFMNSHIEHPNNTALATKLIIDSIYRGKYFDLKVINAITTIACDFGVTKIFLDCRLELENYYKKIGLVRCGSSFDHYETGKVIPMMIDFLNMKHLYDVKSPLLKNKSLREINSAFLNKGEL